METRSFQLAEFRSIDPANPRRLRGLAVVYNQAAPIPTKDGKVFYERIRPGALSRTLTDGHEIKARFEHRDLLATTANGTLNLTDTPEGLAVEIDVAATTAGDDLLALVARGDLRGMSFGWLPASNGQRWTREDGKVYRDVLEIDPLFEITATDSPAYTGTHIATRSVDPAVIAEAERMLSEPEHLERQRSIRRLSAVV